MSRRATIHDVAERVGVSKTAVSFAFNSPDRLPERTVRLILSAADDLGYSPHPVARSMSTGRTGMMGILLPQALPVILGNPFFTELLRGIAEIAQQEDLNLTLVPPVQGSMRRAVTDAAVDGFITVGLESFRPTMVVLERRGLPYVLVDSDPVDGIACIEVDDEGGAYKSMKHLLELGHRRIAILALPSAHPGQPERYWGVLRRRMAGHVRALNELEISFPGDGRLIECTVTEQGGRDGFREAWEEDRRLTAVIAMSDIQALGALSAAGELGLRVPEDVSVVGFDDVPAARWSHLTTVRQPIRAKGRWAAQTLVSLLRGDERAESRLLATELVVRGSTAVPRQDIET